MYSPNVTVLELISHRYSCRSYKSTPVSPEQLARVLECVRLAPTACNRQPFRLVVVETKPHRAVLERIYREAWPLEAPLLLVMVALSSRAWSRRDGVNYAVVDATIAMDHLILGATDEGLGTCWIAAFESAPLAEWLRLGPEEQLVAMTPLGWPADTAPPKERLPIEKLVEYR